MSVRISIAASALSVLLLQNQASSWGLLAADKTGVQPSPNSVGPVTPSPPTTTAPIGVVVNLAQPSIRAGDPIVLQYRFVDDSPSGSYAFPLPDGGKAWLTLHLWDKGGKEVGSASLMDFAGERVVRAVTLQNRQQVVWTHLYICGAYNGRKRTFSDQVTLNALAATALTPGSYTLTAELALPYAVDPLDMKPSTLAFMFPYDRKLEPRGSTSLNVATGVVTFVPAPFDPSQPVVPKATAEIHKTITLSLEVRDEAASVDREAEALAAQITDAYPAPPPELPLPQLTPSQVRRGVYGVGRVPYKYQFEAGIERSRADIQTLFSLNGPAAQRAQLSVAKNIADAAGPKLGERYRIGPSLFYENVALVGTPEVADFLANQAWERKRPEAIHALVTMHEYGNLAIQQKIKEHFSQHQAKMPSYFRATQG